MWPEIAIQFFWFSFSIIGLAIVIVANKRSSKSPAIKAFSTFLETVHFGIAAFIFLCLGFAATIPMVVLGYIFVWPVAVVAFLWLLMLVISIAVLARSYRHISKQFKERFQWKSKRWLLNGLIVFAALALDYAISLHRGGPLNDDVQVHLGKIQLMLSTRMTLADPFIGYNHVLDLDYSTNLLNALQAIAAYLIHVPAYKVWFYSYAFYRLIIWASLFSIAKMFLPERTPKEWPYIIVALAPFIFTSYFFSYVELPHCLVVAWFALFIIGIKLLLDARNPYVMILAALLIAVTHPISALVAAVFLGLMLILLFLTKNINIMLLRAILPTILLLLLPSIAASFIPGHSFNYQGELTKATGLHSTHVGYFKLGPIILPKLVKQNVQAAPFVYLPFFAVGTLLIPYVLLMKRLKNQRLKQFVFYLIALAALAVYNTEYASLVGYIALVSWAKTRVLKISLVLITVYYAIVLYNPVVLTVFYNRVPYWVITRFQDFNALAYIAPILGILVAYNLFAHYWNLKSLSHGYSILLLIIIAALLPIHIIPLNINDIRNFNNIEFNQNAYTYNELTALTGFDRYISNKVVFTNDNNVTELLGDTPHSGYIGMIYNLESSPAQNIQQRLTCQLALFKNLSLTDLEAARVGVIILEPGEDDGLDDNGSEVYFANKYDEPYYAANKLPYLVFQKQIGDDRLYTVKAEPQANVASSVCNIPYGQ